MGISRITSTRFLPLRCVRKKQIVGAVGDTALVHETPSALGVILVVYEKGVWRSFVIQSNEDLSRQRNFESGQRVCSCGRAGQYFRP